MAKRSSKQKKPSLTLPMSFSRRPEAGKPNKKTGKNRPDRNIAKLSLSVLNGAQVAAADGLNLTENARTVLAKRYLNRDEKGNPLETPQDMFRRVAQAVAQADLIHDPKADVAQVEQRFYELMTSLEFLPNSPTLMNAGRELGQLSACFVLPIEDSMDGIFESVKNTALIHKSGGGTGFSFSRLRPHNDPVRSTKGVASGPLSFMKVFDAATETVKQGGTRRGANMAIMSVEHPDILEFIQAKANLDQLNNFNLSVGITEAFMEAVQKDGQYELINPRTKEVVQKLKARQVFDLIVKMAWTNGEPGIVFLDRINQDNPTPKLGEIEATNPCGEQPLLPYESCNLGSINLSLMISEGRVDYEKLERVVKDAVHFLDNVIDINRYPLPRIEQQTKITRKIGLGVMGFADLLVQLEIPYNSNQAVELGEKIMSFIHEKGVEKSQELGQSRGAFPAFEESIFAKSGQVRRHATVTTIAPTGSLSIIAGTTSGIEPLFAVCFVRRILDDQELLEVNRFFFDRAFEEDFLSDDLLDQVAASGAVSGIENVPDKWRKVFVTSHDISSDWHIRMQAAFQKYTDNAVSKTVNFPEDATQEDIRRTYLLAYQSGCKGVTVFRYGSRKPVINLGHESRSEVDEDEVIYDSLNPRMRSKKLRGTTDVMEVGCGKLYVTINKDDIGLCEVITSTGRGGGCPSQSEAVSRLVSLALRCGVSVDAITHQLKGIRCHSALRRNNFRSGPDKTLPCPSAIAKVLTDSQATTREKGRRDNANRPIRPRAAQSSGKEDSTKKPPKSEQPDPQQRLSMQQERELLAQGLCPDCREELEHESGCVVCRSCGFSRCG